jgi:hypothetical protein
MKQFRHLVFVFLLLATISSQAQIGIGTTTPNASAQLDITSTIRGLLMPRMTAIQRAAIGSAAEGLLVYQTDAPAGMYIYMGGAWTIVGAGLSSGSQTGNTPYWNGTTWVTNSSNLFNNGTSIGIGTTNPSVKLHVVGNVRIADGSQGDRKVLMSDGSGNASWNKIVSGYVLIGDVASGISTAVGGDISFASKSNSGSSSTITVNFNDQGSTNFVPMISIISLGTADDDNDIETPVILNVTSTSFDIFLNETNGTTQDIRINVILMPF